MQLTALGFCGFLVFCVCVCVCVRSLCLFVVCLFCNTLNYGERKWKKKKQKKPPLWFVMLTLENFSSIFIIQSIQLSTTEQLLDAVYCFSLSDNTEIHWMSIFSVISLEWVIETSDWLGSSRPSTPSAKTENRNQGTGITIMLPKKLLHSIIT